ncbi:class III extradiol dioxygenase subunit B-like domain-containing protein [Micromonospora sp. DT233]|uniref:class III extradiol dioxygenase subunit B-like domain-containing protein n=1 Tax=Micromonospora sp. DT233 TaxID=3393432 RepID=UPI003CFAEBCC
MPLVAAAVCPHPPLLVPGVAGAAAGELDDLRAACDAAVARLIAAEPELILLVGAGPQSIAYHPAERGTLRVYGVDGDVRLWKVNCAGGERLPLSLTIGAWLIGRSRTELPRFARAVAADAPPPECARFGTELLAEAAGHRVALLVMGDGSACRGRHAPGYDDPRAQAYDDGVARALADADAEALLGLDPQLSAQLRVAGRAPWQALAGAVQATDAPWRGELTYHEAPYGVAYLVANWEPA